MPSTPGAIGIGAGTQRGEGNVFLLEIPTNGSRNWSDKYLALGARLVLDVSSSSSMSTGWKFLHLVVQAEAASFYT